VDYGELPYYDDDFEILVTITDNQTTFESLENATLNPNINQGEFYEVTGSTEHTITFSLEISSSLGGLATGQKLEELAKAGNSYRVKVGDSKYELFKGNGDGCYQSQDVISGENFQIEYDETDIDGDIANRSTIYSPYVNLGLDDSLVGRSMNPSVESSNSGPFEIVSNTGTTMIIESSASDLRMYIGDTFMILPVDGGNIDETSFPDTQLITARIPSAYTSLGIDMGDKGPPYRGTLLDINGDGSLDIVFVANGIFYKLQI